MKALIDGDILIYRIGFTTEDVPLPIAFHRMDELVNSIVDETDADELSIFLTQSGGTSFRYAIYPAYKANRKEKKPKWYAELRKFLCDDYDAIMCQDIEADDGMGIAQTDDTIICTIDKDLDQVPGRHYDFVKKLTYDITPEEAEWFFYRQLLTGDSTDNIPGIPKVGPVKAAKILGHAASERDYLQACVKAYHDANLTREYLTLMGQLVKIKQSEDEPLWDLEVEQKRLGEAGSKMRLRAISKGMEYGIPLNRITSYTPFHKPKGNTNPTGSSETP